MHVPGFKCGVENSRGNSVRDLTDGKNPVVIEVVVHRAQDVAGAVHQAGRLAPDRVGHRSHEDAENGCRPEAEDREFPERTFWPAEVLHGNIIKHRALKPVAKYAQIPAPQVEELELAE